MILVLEQGEESGSTRAEVQVVFCPSNVPFLEVFKARLGGAMGNLICCLI